MKTIVFALLASLAFSGCASQDRIVPLGTRPLPMRDGVRCAEYDARFPQRRIGSRTRRRSLSSDCRVIRSRQGIENFQRSFNRPTGFRGMN